MRAQESGWHPQVPQVAVPLEEPLMWKGFSYEGHSRDGQSWSHMSAAATPMAFTPLKPAGLSTVDHYNGTEDPKHGFPGTSAGWEQHRQFRVPANSVALFSGTRTEHLLSETTLPCCKCLLFLAKSWHLYPTRLGKFAE